MLHLLRACLNPPLRLLDCLFNWHQISLQLREPPRKRISQMDKWEKVIAT